MTHILYDNFLEKHNNIEEKEFNLNDIITNNGKLERKFFSSIYKNKYNWNIFYYNYTFKYKPLDKISKIIDNTIFKKEDDNSNNIELNKTIQYNIINYHKNKIDITDKTKIYIKYYDKLYLIENNKLSDNILNTKNIEYYYNIKFLVNNNIKKTIFAPIKNKIENTNLEYDYVKYNAKYIIIPYRKIPELQFIVDKNKKEFIEKMKESRFDLKKSSAKILNLLKQ